MTCKENIQLQLQCHLEPTLHYVLTSTIKDDQIKLIISRTQYEYCAKLFSILDVGSEGVIRKKSLEKFLNRYCPFISRRDDLFSIENQTVDEIWSLLEKTEALFSTGGCTMSGFLLVCRFVTLIQFHETTRQYCHEQRMQEEQEAVVVMIQMPQNPAPVPPLLSIEELQTHDSTFQNSIPPFDLYLDFCQNDFKRGKQRVSVEHFIGEEYVLRHADENGNKVVVRRYLRDWKWFQNLYKSYGKTGGILCGRILPSIAFHHSLINFKSHSSAVTAVANAGVDAVQKMTKSVASSYYNSASPETSHSMKSPTSINSTALNKQPENVIAKTLERYLNYYLENPALASSFALDTMLNATQPGLNAAKSILKSQNKANRVSSEDAEKVMLQGENHAIVADHGYFDFGTTRMGRVLSTHRFMPKNLTKSYNIVDKMSWIRTAAQAAMTLKVHGILETTGCQSASSKLQHASLPKFVRKESTCENVDDDDITYMDDLDDESFEDVVVSISSELDENGCNRLSFQKPSGGFDLLPPPRPLSERSALCAGSIVKNIQRETRISEIINQGRGEVDNRTCNSANYYREPTTLGTPNIRLGDLSVESDIQRLYLLIAQVQNSMKRCQNATSLLSSIQKKKHELILSLWRGRWLMMGAVDRSMMLQQKLLSGIEKLTEAHEASLKGTEELKENISWEYTLAKSVVKAAKSVNSVIRASKTAERAKVAAELALQTESDNLDSVQKSNGNSTLDEVFISAQKKVSSARSQSIRAAVLEHEGMTAKRRATFAFTFDMKVWNVHRKREMIKLSFDYVKAQVHASRSAISAWEELRDGILSSSDFVDTIDIVRNTFSNLTMIQPQNDPIIQGNNDQNKEIPSAGSQDDISNLVLSLDNIDVDEITEISNSLGRDVDWREMNDNNNISHISIKTDENELNSGKAQSSKSCHEGINNNDYSHLDEIYSNCSSSLLKKNHVTNDILFMEGKQNFMHNPDDECCGFENYDSEDEKLVRSSNNEDMTISPNVIGNSVDCRASKNLFNDSQLINKSPYNLSVSESTNLVSDLDLEICVDQTAFDNSQASKRSKDYHTISEGKDGPNTSKIEINEGDNDLTDSMQSLVDGLMAWGGESPYPSSDDLLCLGGVKN